MPNQDCLTFIGDRQGASNFVFDLCNGPSQTSHYLVPRVITNRAQGPEDLAYLRLKGCFSLPSQNICEDLIRAYFLHVHPFLPIIDAGHFLAEFVKHEYQNINLLLLWSVFFAATNVGPASRWGDVLLTLSSLLKMKFFRELVTRPGNL